MTYNNKHINKIFIIFFIFALALIFTSIFIEKTLFDDESKITALDNAEKKVFEREEYFKGILNGMRIDAYSLLNSKMFADFFENSNEESKQKLTQLLLTLGKFHANITQLRYLDTKGMETIRIHKDEKNRYVSVPTDKLQDKSKRDYFIDAKKKKLGEIYFSAFDLNIEHGKVEVPFKPTLRVFVPLEKRGNFQGLLIINYSMSDFLKKFINSPLYDVILADENAYTLYHYDEEKSWGRYQNEKYTIKNDFPDTYQHIFLNNFFRTKEFVSKKLDVNIGNNLYLILQFKKSLHDIEKQKKIEKEIILAILVLLFSGISIFFIIRVFKDVFFNYDEIEKLNQKLEEQAKMISENSIYSQTDLTGVITDVSEGFCKLSGYSRDELIGKSHNIVRHPDMPSSVYRELWTKLKQEEPWDGEILNKDKDGGSYWVYSRIAPYYDGNKHIGYISSRVNITSQKEIEIQETLLKEREKFAILGEMFGNIVHQWKQPLSAISAISNNIQVSSQLGTLDESKIKSYADSIEESIQFLTETIDTFKNYILGKKELKHYPIQVEINKVLTIMKPIIKAQNITLESNLDDIEDIYLDMTTNELSQVLMVLISNAKDVFEERKIREPWIKVELSKNKDKVILTIEDNGGGIPSDVLTKLFEKYFSTKGEDKGTGLGLFMSKEIIEESLNGKLFVENTENGAKFFIELPL